MNIAINGFGRIGRSIYRIITSQTNHKVVAINDLSDINALAYLLKYDTVMGNFKGEVRIENNNLISPNQIVKIFSNPDPSQLPWNDNNVDIVIESTGIFRTREEIEKHIIAGAKINSNPNPADIIPIIRIITIRFIIEKPQSY